MRPIQLIMSAFGSYATEVRVSFEEHNHGIFLITGDTGAGKTTIFDAISYALYDRTSGGLRDGNMMRSHYASEDTPTFVELSFLYQGQRYIVRRNPVYERMKKKKNSEGKYETTKQIASVSLRMPDGSEYPGNISSINKKIIEIMGIDGNQFTQIAMIAQGDFLRLLHAESDKRKEIFSRIFDTRIYAAIQGELRDRTREINELLIMNRTQCVQELAGVLCPKDSSFQEEWEDKKQFSEVSPKDSVELIEKINDELKERELRIQSEGQGIKEKLNAIRTQMISGKQMNDLLDRLEQLQKEAFALAAKKDAVIMLESSKEWAKKALKVHRRQEYYLQMKQECESLDVQIKQLRLIQNQLQEELRKSEETSHVQELELQKVREEEGKKILQLEVALDKYDLAEDLAKQYQKYRADWMILDKESKGLETKLEAASQKERLLEEEQLANQGVGEIYLRLKQEEEKLESHEKVFTEILFMTKELEKNKKDLDRKHEAWKKKDDEYVRANQEYEDITMAFFKEQAGILAQELEEGAACPVCGSIHHPNKAQIHHVAYSQEEVENKKKSIELLHQEVKRSEKLYQESESKYQLLQNSIEIETRRILGADFLFGPNQVAVIEESNKANSLELDKIRKETDQALNRKVKSEANVKFLLEIKQAIEVDRKKKEDIEKQKNEIRTEAEGKKARLEEMSKELPEANKKVANERLAFYKKNLEEAQKRFENAQNHLKEVQQRSNTNKGSLQLCEGNLSVRKEELKKAQTLYEEEISKQGFDDETQYLAKCLKEEEIEGMEEEIRLFYQKESEIHIQISNYRLQTKDAKPVNLASLVESEKQEQLRLEELEKDEKQIYSILQNNMKAYHNLRKLFTEREKKVHAFEQISRLEKTANGSLSGSQKIDFQTYVQRLYFQHIIVEANKRLHVMSGEQFVLKRRELEDSSKQGKSGLDLDVHNLVTNKNRDVKTLSGGESFMASLCMALGMADVIQNTAGRVHLDTMFIDEGFGSLDEESREQAIRILNGLAEGKRLVGIISHVTELKERIPLKLIVSKDEKGSRICWQDER